MGAGEARQLRAQEGGKQEASAESSGVTRACFRAIRTQGCPCEVGTPTLSRSFTGREGRRSHRARAARGFLGDTKADGVPERGEPEPGGDAD